MIEQIDSFLIKIPVPFVILIKKLWNLQINY